MPPNQSEILSTLSLPLTSSPKSEFWAGVRAVLPLVVGVVPFGMIYGVLALGAGLPPSAAQAMSAIVFAGSSQFAAAQLFAVGTPALVVTLTIVVLNLRHALYSASIAPYLKPLSPVWKGLLAYLLTDEAYAVSILHYDRPGSLQNKHWFFLGSGLALWTSWQISTALGIFLGAVIPSSWSLDFALALTFIAMVVPSLRDRPGLAAALSAGTAAVLLYQLPYNLGLIAAALVGITVGLLVERGKP
jgi:4-azaleucine resistance transporter AzlC